MARLRPPTLEERKAGLPKTKQEAINAGLTRFIPEDNIERVIRGYGSKRRPGGDVKTAASRKGGARKRKIAKSVTTPDKATRKAADQTMVEMRARGNVGHHGLPINYLAAGELEKPGTVAKYEKVHGKGKVGHAPGALVEMSIPEHQYLHNVLESAYERSIKGAKGSLDPIDLIRQQVRFLESNPMARRSLAVVLPVATPMLAEMDVEAREKAVQQDPSILNKLQAGLSKVELAGETGSLAGMATAATGVGAVPGAALMAGSEVVSSAAGLANLTIDGVRSAVMFGAHNRIRGRSGAMRATSP